MVASILAYWIAQSIQFSEHLAQLSGVRFAEAVNMFRDAGEYEVMVGILGNMLSSQMGHLASYNAYDNLSYLAL